MNRIDIKNLTKRYGRVQALNDVSFQLESGKIYGLLGRNGAGKTTLLNIIANRLFADSGEVTVDGLPAKENDTAQGLIYFMGEKNYYPHNLRVSEAFKWTKAFYPDFDAALAQKLCEQFKLNPGKRIRDLSTGYSSIHKIITALCVNAPYTLLDEPVLGLDANHRELFYKTLLNCYSDNPRTFLISTHLIEEVSGLIEDILIIKEGRIIKNESCEALLASGYTASGAAAVVDSFVVGKNVIGMDTLGGLKSAHILGTVDKTNLPETIEITRLDLQKLFIQLTNG